MYFIAHHGSGHTLKTMFLYLLGVLFLSVVYAGVRARKARI